MTKEEAWLKHYGQMKIGEDFHYAPYTLVMNGFLAGWDAHKNDQETPSS